jgi:Ca2+-binding RTX toxin-like protein
VGADGLYGSGGNDLLYGDVRGDTAQFIAQGATQSASGAQGDWFDAEDGDDKLFGGAGNDLMAEGVGDDTLTADGDKNDLNATNDTHWRLAA